MPKKTESKVPPCPYCADPALLDAPKGKPTEETYPVPHYGGRFWRKAGPPSFLHGFNYGARWVADVPAEYFGEAFAGFSARLVGVEIGFVLPTAPPAPFSNSISMHLRTRPPLVPSPHEGAAPTVAVVLFSGCVIEHEGGGVEVRAHWWPSHGWIITQRLMLTASDPAGRNEQLERAHAALNFFLLETRGAPKITEADVSKAIRGLGKRATQKAVAARLNVNPSTLRDLQRRINKPWGKLISEANK